MIKHDIQLEFIEKIKSRLSKHINLAETIAELLAISIDSAYRRLRGTTSFTITEIETLCMHFKINFSIDRQGEINANFGYKKISQDEEAIENYLIEFSQTMEEFKNHSKNELLITANDIPPFYYFNEKELTAFKLFYWRNSILGDQDNLKKFTLDTLNTKAIEVGKKIYHHFTSIPSTEIWTESSFDSTLKQIDYCWESGIIEKKEVAVVLCDQVENILKEINAMASVGYKKTTSSKYIVYYSDIIIGNNIVIMINDQFKKTLISFNTINALQTTNELFSKEIELWINQLIKKSTLISQIGEKQRNQFTKISSEKINTLRKKIGIL